MWKGRVLATSYPPHTIVEGNVYFPLESVDRDLVSQNPNSEFGTTFCHWKGLTLNQQSPAATGRGRFVVALPRKLKTNLL